MTAIGERAKTTDMTTALADKMSRNTTTHTDGTDLDTVQATGFHRVYDGEHAPTTGGLWYQVISYNWKNASQTAYGTGRMFYGCLLESIWQPWVEMFHSGNFDPADYVVCYKLFDEAYVFYPYHWPQMARP